MATLPDSTYEFPDDFLSQNQHVFDYSESREGLKEKIEQLKFYNIVYCVTKVPAVKHTADRKNDQVVSSPVQLWLVLTEGVPVTPKRDALGRSKSNRLNWKIYHLCPIKMNLPCEECPNRTGCLIYKFQIKPKLDEIERKRKERSHRE